MSILSMNAAMIVWYGIKTNNKLYRFCLFFNVQPGGDLTTSRDPVSTARVYAMTSGPLQLCSGQFSQADLDGLVHGGIMAKRPRILEGIHTHDGSMCWYTC
jgi:hypothetical protein